MDILALIRRSLRGLLRAPSFTALCVLTLAVGIAVATAIFSIVNGVLLTPLPYAESERLVGLWHAAPAFGFDKLSQSPGTYQLYRQRSRSIEDIALYQSAQVNVTGGEAPERLPAALITPSLFPVLRAKPSLGRAFVAEEGRPGAAPVVLLSDQLWRRRFAADPGALGRHLRINGVPRVIVGVMPAGFEFPRPETELWLPLEVDPARAEFGAFGPSGVARLRPGITPAAAQAELEQLLAGLSSGADEAASGLIQGGFHARVVPLREDVVGDIGRTLWILLGAVGFILLIACANVGNLLIVRGEGRRRETAIHTALGASPRQVMGSVLLESLLLAGAAGGLGLLLAAGGLSLLLKLGPLGLPRLKEIGIDGSVLLFAAAAAVLSSLLAGLFPALRSLLKGDLALELKTGGTRSTSSHAQQRMRRFLVGLQVGLVLILLTGSGLMLRSFLRLSQLDPGFATEDVLTLQLSLPEQDFPDDVAAAGFLARAVERLAALPGVRSAGVASTLPLSSNSQASRHIIEDRPPQPGAPEPVLWVGHASEGYFEALGIPLFAGRALTRADQENRAGVAVVNQALARRFWPNGNALGKRLRPAAAEEGGSEPWYTIVGIVGDVRNRDLAVTTPDEIVYYPLLGQSADAWTVRQANVVLRTRVVPESLASEVRSAVWSVDPNVPVSGVRPMEQILRRSQARMIYAVLMFVLATVVAIVLAAVGIYGFVSYVVSQRTAEVGVRMALGAHARDIRWLILRELLAIALAGVLVGLLGAVTLTRWLGSLLFEISPLDPLTFIMMPLLLLAVVLLSSALPAERAARIDPVKALKFS